MCSSEIITLLRSRSHALGCKRIVNLLYSLPIAVTNNHRASRAYNDKHLLLTGLESVGGWLGSLQSLSWLSTECKRGKLLEALIHFHTILLAKEITSVREINSNFKRETPKVHTKACDAERDEEMGPLMQTIYHTHQNSMGRVGEGCFLKENIHPVNGKSDEQILVGKVNRLLLLTDTLQWKTECLKIDAILVSQGYCNKLL